MGRLESCNPFRIDYAFCCYRDRTYGRPQTMNSTPRLRFFYEAVLFLASLSKSSARFHRYSAQQTIIKHPPNRRLWRWVACHPSSYAPSTELRRMNNSFLFCGWLAIRSSVPGAQDGTAKGNRTPITRMKTWRPNHQTMAAQKHDEYTYFLLIRQLPK